MSNPALACGGAVLRSAPWQVLLPATAVAGALFGTAVLRPRDATSLLFALVAVGVCGAVAGYVLDEEASEVADATPASRPRRAAWRIMIVLLPAAVAATALVWADRLAPQTHALRMLPVAAGAVAIGTALAAAMRRSGTSAPGDLAGVLTFGTVVVAVLADPLRRWLSLRPFETTTYPARTAIAWAGVVLLCTLTVLACERDPGSAPLPIGQRKDTT